MIPEYSKVQVLKRFQPAPAGMVRWACDINPGLFTRVTQRNGGQISMTAYQELIVDSELIERVTNLARKTLPSTPARQTVSIPLALDKTLYEDLQHVHGHLTSTGPVALGNSLVLLTIGMLRNLLGTSSFEETERLLAHLERDKPKSLAEAADKIQEFVIRKERM